MDSALFFSLSSPHPKNQFHDRIDFHKEPILWYIVDWDPLKSLKIWAPSPQPLAQSPSQAENPREVEFKKL
jgi:hypothetical protein